MQTKYIPQANADKILKLLGNAQKICPNIRFEIKESEEGTILYNGWSKSLAVNEMDGVEADFGINCYDGDKYLGWFFITPYEDEDCVVCDHTDNKFCNQCVKEN